MGDWGKQFGMLIVAYKKWGNEEAVKAHPIDELLKLYVRINAEAENDPSLDEEAREWFRKLENGDEEALALWQWFRDESLVEFNRLYNELQVEFDSYNGEAFYNDKMDAVVDILSEKGLLVESEGAQVVNLEKYGIEHPALIKKSDGATLYITRDLAAALYRKNEYQFAKIYLCRWSRTICSLQTTQGCLARNGLRLEPRYCPCSVWLGYKRREKTFYS